MSPSAGVYLDTSALGRLVLDEPDADAIGASLDDCAAVISSRLLRIELHRLGLRTGIEAPEIEAWLSGVALVPIHDGIITAAERISPPPVATLDAIHLATAVSLAAAGHVTSVMTFDARLAEGALAHGLPVSAPR